MNNNRGGNNRRRGRTNNSRPQGTNGGQQVNRIDSRARGNAPQMLEKYRKLANDAHLNGDRVNAEYNLQFADHYFRVIADTRVRQEEQRLRRDDRWPEGGEGASDDGNDAEDFGADTEFASFDQPPVYTRREREDRPERSSDRTQDRAPERSNERVSSDRGQDRPQSQSDTRRRDERAATDDQAGRGGNRNYEPIPVQNRVEEQAAAAQTANGPLANANDASEASVAGATAYEPAENPFLRENRGGRGLRPRREDRRPRREDHPEAAALGETQETDRTIRAMSAGIDPETLPPSFTVAREQVDVEPEVLPEAAPVAAPRKRARRKPATDDSGEPIQSLT